MSDFPLEDNIIEAVRSRQRAVKNGVLPKTVLALLPIRVAEQTVRRYMARLWREGRLYRFGGNGARRGYRALKAAEERLEAEAIALLEKYPFGLTTQRLAELIEVGIETVTDYLPQLEYRGLIVFSRGAWRVPTYLQKISYAQLGHFGYKQIA